MSTAVSLAAVLSFGLFLLNCSKALLRKAVIYSQMMISFMHRSKCWSIEKEFTVVGLDIMALRCAVVSPEYTLICQWILLRSVSVIINWLFEKKHIVVIF